MAAGEELRQRGWWDGRGMRGCACRLRKIGQAAAAAERADGGGSDGQNQPAAGLTRRFLTGGEVSVRGKGPTSILEFRGTHFTTKLNGWTIGG
jgi:hypothetical protein